eukprot:scaffold83806_cov20-Tisochrysis_lutea.AAC.2
MLHTVDIAVKSNHLCVPRCVLHTKLYFPLTQAWLPQIVRYHPAAPAPAPLILAPASTCCCLPRSHTCLPDRQTHPLTAAYALLSRRLLHPNPLPAAYALPPDRQLHPHTAADLTLQLHSTLTGSRINLPQLTCSRTHLL